MKIKLNTLPYLKVFSWHLLCARHCVGSTGCTVFTNMAIWLSHLVFRNAHPLSGHPSLSPSTLYNPQKSIPKLVVLAGMLRTLHHWTATITAFPHKIIISFCVPSPWSKELSLPLLQYHTHISLISKCQCKSGNKGGINDRTKKNFKS